MSRFFVGQHVRIVGPSRSGLTGREARIISCREANHTRYGWGLYYQVDVDGHGRISSDGLQLSFPESALEPILPSGHQPAEMDVHELLPFLKERVTA